MMRLRRNGSSSRQTRCGSPCLLQKMKDGATSMEANGKAANKMAETKVGQNGKSQELHLQLQEFLSC